jgi:hypothetical protein
MMDAHQFNCHVTQNLFGEMGKIARRYNSPEYKEFFWNPKVSRDHGFYLRQITSEERVFFETEHPLLIACNYSFNPTQTDILSRDFPVLFEDQFSVMLASDKQTPASEQEMYVYLDTDFFPF